MRKRLYQSKMLINRESWNQFIIQAYWKKKRAWGLFQTCIKTTCHKIKAVCTHQSYLVFLPLLGSGVAGFFGRFLGSEGSAIMTTTCVSFSSIFSLIALACTTYYLDLPDVICLVLFGSLYWLFLYLSLSIYIRWGLFQTCIKTTYHKIKAACTHQSYLVFFLNILNIIFFYALIYLSYLVLEGDKETFVKILLIMSECSSIYFCFCSQTELSRFQAVYSFFLSYLLTIIILEKLSVSLFFNLFFLFLVVEFLLVKYKGFFPFHFSFFVILIAFLLICPEIRLWGFNLVVQLVFLYLLKFLLHKFSHIAPSPSLFFYLLFLLVSLLFIESFSFRDTSFQLQILFLGAGSLVIYFCFLSETGWELVITTLSYILLNFIIGGFITYKGSIFLQSSILYFFLNFFIFFNIFLASRKKSESLTSISNQIKVRVVLVKLSFLLVILRFIKENSTYSWIWTWLTTFTLQIISLNLFFCFFNKKEDEFFQTLGRKQTTFLSRLIIYGSALLFYLLYYIIKIPFFFMFAWGG